MKGYGFIGLEKEGIQGSDSNDKIEIQGTNVDEGDKFMQNEDSDEEIFTVKRKDHGIDDDENESAVCINEDLTTGKKQKVLTKAQLAKKMAKKKIQANSKVNFDEDGEVVSEATKQKLSKEGKDYEDEDADRIGGGINIEKAKEVLKAEDKFDKATERARIKEKHKEDKRKQKEENRRKAKEERGELSDDNGESDYSEPDLSWLPDPDKVYGKEGKTNESGSESDYSDSDNEEPSNETVEVKEGKRKLTVIKSVIPAKRSRHTSSSSEDSEDEVLDTGLSLGDDEDLALKLLNR